MQKQTAKIHYGFLGQGRPVCGACGQVYITSDKFFVSCKTCLKHLNYLKERVLKDERSYGTSNELIKIAEFGKRRKNE